MDLVIRQYCKEDFTSVCDLERENSPQGCKPEVFIRQAGVLFADTFLVAECGGEVIGYTIGALVQQRPATGWIIRLVVSGKHRRKGFGDSLVTAVISGLLERGAEEIYLSVAPGNELHEHFTKNMDSRRPSSVRPTSVKGPIDTSSGGASTIIKV